MAAFNRLTEATYEVHESVKVDTQDNEDHTFCGIMFPIKCKDILPVDQISIRSIAVRGQLGPLTVWVSKVSARNNSSNNNNGTTVFKLKKSHWHKVYEANHPPSPHEYSSLVLQEPILLKPGQVRAIYIHSTLPGDQAIVYDNAAFYVPHRMHHFGGGRHHRPNNNNHNVESRQPRYQDAMVSIYSGRAHVSNTPFGQMPIWGWGNAWRDHREFVGQLEYGAVYQLWNPEVKVQHKFGPKFQQALFHLKLCQTRWESPISRLPDECIYYILNMCRWDWFQDTPETMTEQAHQQKEQRRRQQQQQLQLQLEQQQQEEEERARQEQQDTTIVATTTTAATSANGDDAVGNSSPVCCCNGNNNDDDDDDDDEDSQAQYADAVEEENEFDDAMEDGNVDVNVDVDVEEAVDEVIAEAAEDNEDEDEGEDDEEDEWEETSDDEDGDDDDDDDSDAWERANGYRADHNVFRFVDPEMEQDDGDDDNEDEEGALRHAWIRRQFDRISVLRALAREQDEVDMDIVF